MIAPRLAFVTVLLAAPLAGAAEHAGHDHSSSSASPADEDEGPEPIAPAADTLGGHLIVGAGPLISVPFAELDDQTDFGDVAGLGVGVTGDIGIGLSRHLSLAGWIQYASFGHPSSCNGCKATSLAFGPLIRYHLVQGTRFDPHLSLGVGYRRLDATTDDGKDQYTGIDWLKFELGGTWYALSQLGFGPFVELNLGSFTDRPSGRDTSVYGSVAFGLRVALDPRGK
jgi:hypothetical protein